MSVIVDCSVFITKFECLSLGVVRKIVCFYGEVITLTMYVVVESMSVFVDYAVTLPMSVSMESCKCSLCLSLWNNLSS